MYTSLYLVTPPSYLSLKLVDLWGGYYIYIYISYRIPIVHSNTYLLHGPLTRGIPSVPCADPPVQAMAGPEIHGEVQRKSGIFSPVDLATQNPINHQTDD